MRCFFLILRSLANLLNRLRNIYRPDLSTIVTSKPLRKTHRDREWAFRKSVADVQEIVFQNKKRKTTYKKK